MCIDQALFSPEGDESREFSCSRGDQILPGLSPAPPALHVSTLASSTQRSHRTIAQYDYLGDLYTESGQTLQGSFSAVSAPIVASKYAFFRIFRDLQDAHTFAPLEIENLSKNSSNFLVFCKKFCKNRYFSTLSIEFCSDFDENFSEFHGIY